MAKSERKPEPTIGDLAMLVARLVRQVRRLEPDNDVAEKAMCYLRRHNLQGSILRETNQINDGAILDFVRRVMQWEHDYDWTDRQVISQFNRYVRELREWMSPESSQ